MKHARKAKVSVTLARDLLAAIDRRVVRGTTRTQGVERGVRLPAPAQARRDLDAATPADHEGRTAEQRAEDEDLAAFSTRAVDERELDRKPRTRRPRAR